MSTGTTDPNRSSHAAGGGGGSSKGLSADSGGSGAQSLPVAGAAAASAGASQGELSKQYRPSEHEDRIFERWLKANAFHADPMRVVANGGEREPFCVLIPPPNVTDRLHLGHALNNTLQDVLVRAHRMMGYEALWMPGTDHAGIATQAVIEKRLRASGELKGPLRESMKREDFIARTQAFKDEYEAIITGQLKKMGCSCDWERQRFTMDEVCARAVREAFFRFFRDGLIYRGKRLVNWDPVLQTAVADDECFDEEIDGAFYYLRYPLVHAGSEAATQRGSEAGKKDKTAEDAQPVTWDELARRGYPGAEEHNAEEAAWITVATTRPETYLGDTAVALNPHDPRAKALKELFVELPLIGRVVPIIEDSYVVLPERYARNDEEKADPKAKMATGFLKVTPAHDPNDYEIGQRHKSEIEAAGNAVLINVMAPDATISDKHGWNAPGEVRGAHMLIGKTREEARKLVIAEFKSRGLLEGIKPHRHSVKHSDRSKAIIEPYLSDQWYLKVTDPRMAQNANNALAAEQRTTQPRGTGVPPVPTPPTSSPSPRGTDVPSVLAPSPSRGTDVPSVSSPLPSSSSPPWSLPPTTTRLSIRERNLPHWEMGGHTYFVTFRTAKGELSPHERDVVLAACRHWDGERLELHAACVMPDHVHLIFSPFEKTPGEWFTLSEVLHSIKSFTGHAIAKERGLPGGVWQDESYDRLLREGEFGDALSYVLSNPVAARLASEWRGYRWTWAPEESLEGRVRFAERWREGRGRNARGTPRDSRGEVEGVGTGGTPVPQGGQKSGNPLRTGGSDLQASRSDFREDRNPLQPDGNTFRGSGTPLRTDRTLPGAAHGGALDAHGAPGTAHGADGRTPGDSDAGDGSMRFFPARYAKTYELWHENIRDWCISRQLWWGHRIPVWRLQNHWRRSGPAASVDELEVDWEHTIYHKWEQQGRIAAHRRGPEGGVDPTNMFSGLGEQFTLSICIKDPNDQEVLSFIERDGAFIQDPDVLDTWFSSALWPLSTMGWPDAAQAAKDTGIADFPKLLDAFNPTSTLCTAREIITLWVSRMTMYNRYLRGEAAKERGSEAAQNSAAAASSPASLPRCVAGPPPFRDVFIHAVIQDGHGQKMSKSLGNGVDPLDIIASHGADAMRFTLCHMSTQTQDVRMPVDLICPHTGEVFTPKFITNKDGYTVTAPVQDSPKDKSKKMVTVYGVASGEAKASAEMPLAKTTSTKFDIGRNYANKLWNATRFVLGMLGGSEAGTQRGSEAGTEKNPPPGPLPEGGGAAGRALIDRWMLSRVANGVATVEGALKNYEYSTYAAAVYDLLWRDFCDWYLEGIKPTVAGDARQRDVLVHSLEAIVRLLHPIMPFVTEAIWEKLRDVPRGEVAGVTLGGSRQGQVLCTAAWPKVDAALRDEAAEAAFERVRGLVTAIRDVRAQRQVPPKRRVTLHVPKGAAIEDEAGSLVRTFAGVEAIATDGATPAPAGAGAVAFTFEGAEYRLSNLRDEAAAGAEGADAGAEKARLAKQIADKEKSIATLKGRLSNPGYTDKAPPHMVQQTKDQLAAAEAELGTLRAALGKL